MLLAGLKALVSEHLRAYMTTVSPLYDDS